MNYQTCVLAYYPQIINVEKDKIKMTCFDKKIHVKLRNYNRATKIAGFEAKLNYLLSYLLHFQYLHNKHVEQNLSQKNIKAYLQEFSKTKDVTEILSVIQHYSLEHNVIGISIKENKQVDKPFGYVIPEYFPIMLDRNHNFDSTSTYDLDKFLSTLKISIYDYLFNDKYVIILSNNMKTNINKKFINKQLKHKQKLDTLELDVITLW